MTFENIKNQYEWFKFLASGEFTERDFDGVLKSQSGEDGRHAMGKMTPERKALIMGDALRNKEEIESKFPELVKVEEPVIEAPKKTKKVKKKESEE